MKNEDLTLLDPSKEKEVLTERISNILKVKEYVLFAYIFGSFVSKESFKDIDVGIFISGEKPKLPLKLELEIEAELEDIIHIPVDVRIINNEKCEKGTGYFLIEGIKRCRGLREV